MVSEQQIKIQKIIDLNFIVKLIKVYHNRSYTVTIYVSVFEIVDRIIINRRRAFLVMADRRASSASKALVVKPKGKA